MAVAQEDSGPLSLESLQLAVAKINSCVGKRLAQPADDCAAVRTPVPQLCTEGVYFLMHHATCLPFDDMQLPIVEDVSLLHQPNDDWNPRKAVQLKFSQLLPERGVMCSLRRQGFRTKVFRCFGEPRNCLGTATLWHE